MPATEVLIAFLAATAVFAYLPGPAMLYATAQTLARGRRGGFLAALGIHLGGYVHVMAAAVGLAAVFQWVPLAYAALKLAGAAYLVWLGIKLLVERVEVMAPTVPTAGCGHRVFVESVLVEVLNPKTAVFFVAFLPQFADPAAALPIWAQLLVLGTVVNLLFSSADIVCVLGAGAIADRLRRSARLVMWTRRMGGLLLVGLGARLALDRSGP